MAKLSWERWKSCPSCKGKGWYPLFTSLQDCRRCSTKGGWYETRGDDLAAALQTEDGRRRYMAAHGKEVRT